MDVNVHPAKTVVKFVSDKTVFDAVYYIRSSTRSPPVSAPHRSRSRRGSIRT